jgi:gliding motility-associated lipoprotein GldH
MRRIPERIKLLLIILLTGMIISCDSARIFEENVVVEKGIWNVKNKMKFEVPISDIQLRYNVYINVRNSPEYPYSNLFLFLNTGFPDGKMTRDTIELTLADYDGRWLGSGIGSMKFSRFLLQKGVQLKQTGNYRFEFEQAMRVNELKGIRDIGLRIEKE